VAKKHKGLAVKTVGLDQLHPDPANARKHSKRNLDAIRGSRSYFDVTGGRFRFGDYLREAGAETLPGFQIRYLFFLKPEERVNLVEPELPYSRIAEMGAGMYRGQRRGESIDADAPGDQPGEGGSIPTSPLHPNPRGP